MSNKRRYPADFSEESQDKLSKHSENKFDSNYHRQQMDLYKTSESIRAASLEAACHTTASAYSTVLSNITSFYSRESRASRAEAFLEPEWYNSLDTLLIPPPEVISNWATLTWSSSNIENFRSARGRCVEALSDYRHRTRAQKDYENTAAYKAIASLEGQHGPRAHKKGHWWTHADAVLYYQWRMVREQGDSENMSAYKAYRKQESHMTSVRAHESEEEKKVREDRADEIVGGRKAFYEGKESLEEYHTLRAYRKGAWWSFRDAETEVKEMATKATLDAARSKKEENEVASQMNALDITGTFSGKPFSNTTFTFNF